MLLSVRLDPRAARLWQVGLLDVLARRPDTTVVIAAGEGASRPVGVERLFRLETRLHGLRGSGAAEAVDREHLARYWPTHPAKPDLTLDLCGDAPVSDGRVWRLTFDGQPGEAGLVTAIMGGRAPLAEIREGSALVAAGRLGTDATGILVSTVEDMLARTITLVCGAFDGAAPQVPILEGPAPGRAIGVSSTGLGLFAAKTLARRLLRSVHRRLYRSPHWRVGWRKLDGPDLVALRDHPAAGWRDLPDDGARFYADPFPLLYKGALTLFVEEFPHETGKGIIAALRFGPDGPIGTPEPVLELPYHLSYPFVFERDGAVWMIPESCAAGTVDLFRATRFPGGWVKEATLVEGVAASDATLCEWEGRWWMFATVKGQGAFSDALHLWSAPHFRGPWTPHPRNPVLIDIASARPAGRMVQRDGAIIRPVQDCRTGYGAALGFARVRQLDDAGFAQDIETILTAGPRWPGRRLHTLNEAGGFEFIDGSGWARRVLRRRRAAAGS